MVIKLVGIILLSFALGLLLGKPTIKIANKLNARQAILSYVDNHSQKAGTPTMGGVIFIIPTAVVTLSFSASYSQMAIVAVLAMLSYGIVGFLDDFIKIRHKENLGLKAYQKIIAQSGIAIIMTAYCYFNPYIGSSINLPFSDITFNLGWWYLPFTFILYIATTNAVNLTDGLDGLAGGTSAVCAGVLTALIAFGAYNASYGGQTLYSQELEGLSFFSASLFGGLLAFLVYNSCPARIFMGDTGSLAIGGALASMVVFSMNPLIILILGIMYVVSCISVIMQVIYFKLTKGKRIFLMAPLHHHFQYKGVKESKIVAVYTIITIIVGVICLLA